MATLILVVGLPGAGKTAYARRVAAERPALRLTPDEWMIALFGPANPSDQRDRVEGRLISVGLDALDLGIDVVLDFGFWTRDERASLRAVARARGHACVVVYLAVDEATQRERVARRWATTPGETFAMSDAEMAAWRSQFEVPDRTELSGGPIGPPPEGASWEAWASDRWPSLVL